MFKKNIKFDSIMDLFIEDLTSQELDDFVKSQCELLLSHYAEESCLTLGQRLKRHKVIKSLNDVIEALNENKMIKG